MNRFTVTIKMLAYKNFLIFICISCGRQCELCSSCLYSLHRYRTHQKIQRKCDWRSRKKKVPTQVKHENTFKLKSLNPKKGISNNGIRNFKYLCEWSLSTIGISGVCLKLTAVWITFLRYQSFIKNNCYTYLITIFFCQYQKSLYQ